MKKRKLILMPIVLFALIFVQCSKDDDSSGMGNKGEVMLKVTDAPADDANIKGTFITIADVKVDGQSLEGFTKQTIEISAYQKGEAKLLFDKELEAKTYNSVSIVLDNETDESGNAPGCYVLTSDDKKNNLALNGSSESEITFSKPVNVESNSQISLVVDFDLRKLIVRNTDMPEESGYKFVTSTEMESGVRMVNEQDCGEITGKVNATLNTDNDVYIFIYKKGEFNKIVESQKQGSSNVLFANAVTSAKVENDGSYMLSFIENGDYEIHLATYKKETENKWTFNGMLNADSSVSGLLLNNLSVEANSQIELNIDVLSTVLN